MKFFNLTKKESLSKKWVFLSVFVFVLTFTISNNASALGGLTTEINPTIEIDISPKYPEPNDNVSLSIRSYSFNVSHSLISVYINGTLEKQAIGLRSFSFNAGSLGESKNIRIVAESNKKGVITKNIKVESARIDILWEANTYTPPFYKGKALQSAENTVSIEVYPEIYKDGVRLNPEKLSYKWRGNNQKVLKEGFGEMGRSFSIKNLKKTRPIELFLEVSSLDNTKVVKKYIEIPVNKTDLLFYEKNPLMGIIYKNALTEKVAIKNEEITISAEPYFLSINDKESENINYNWSVGGREREHTGEKKHTMTLKKVGETEGEVELSLFIRNIKEVLQSASASIDVSY